MQDEGCNSISLIYEILYLAYGIKTNCCFNKLVLEISIQSYRNTNYLLKKLLSDCLHIKTVRNNQGTKKFKENIIQPLLDI